MEKHENNEQREVNRYALRVYYWLHDTLIILGILSAVIISTGIQIEFDPADLASADAWMKQQETKSKK